MMKNNKQLVLKIRSNNRTSSLVLLTIALCCLLITWQQYATFITVNDKDITYRQSKPCVISSGITNNNNNNNNNNVINDINDINDNSYNMKQTKNQNKKRLSLSDITKNPPAGSLECPPLMTPIYDRIVIDDNAQKARTRKIPKIIHITSKSRCVPTDVYADGIQQWKDKLPDHSFYFHDDNAIDIFFNQDWSIEFPNIHRIMKCILYKGAMKIDLWRMLIVYEFGGWYTDIDNTPAKELNNNNNNKKNNPNNETILDEDSFFASATSGKNPKPNQNVFAMSPKHPIADFTIQRILSNLYNDVDNIQKVALVQITGPVAFDAGYHDFFRLTHKGPPDTYQAFKKEKLGIYNKGTFLGLQIHRGEYWNWKNMDGDKKIKSNDGSGWIDRKSRANKVGNTPHWRTRKDRIINTTATTTPNSLSSSGNNNNNDDIVSTIKNDPNNNLVISCREYLYRINQNNHDSNNSIIN